MENLRNPREEFTGQKRALLVSTAGAIVYALHESGLFDGGSTLRMHAVKETAKSYWACVSNIEDIRKDEFSTFWDASVREARMLVRAMWADLKFVPDEAEQELLELLSRMDGGNPL